jgi:soluble lytic murein transglycosylase-like protein
MVAAVSRRSAIPRLLRLHARRLARRLSLGLARVRDRALRELLRQARKPAVIAVALAGLGSLVSLNLALRGLGADVHPLSIRRVPERSLALAHLLVHRLQCDDGELSAAELVRAAALRHGVPVRLALAVARAESGLVHTRISATGAMGLMQLMPATAHELGVRDPFDARENADGGVRYLAQLLAVYRGDARRAVAAYNAGMGRVPRFGPHALPRETRTYLGRVFSAL